MNTTIPWSVRNRRETQDDRPRSWLISYEDGSDGCLPAGWYAEGLDSRGWRITEPVYHTYGPFETEEDAELQAKAVDESFW